jgi:hypothetical protein
MAPVAGTAACSSVFYLSPFAAQKKGLQSANFCAAKNRGGVLAISRWFSITPAPPIGSVSVAKKWQKKEDLIGFATQQHHPDEWQLER